MTANRLTQKYLKSILHYNPDTGMFAWTVRRGSKAPKDGICGCIKDNKYRVIRIDDVLHLAHRLAFLYMEGDLPPNSVDHLNHKRDDNRWLNLRHATSKDNNRNMSLNSQNTSGVSGVCFDKAQNNWVARIWDSNKAIFLGRRKSFADAVELRRNAETQYEYHRNHCR